MSGFRAVIQRNGVSAWTTCVQVNNGNDGQWYSHTSWLTHEGTHEEVREVAAKRLLDAIIEARTPQEYITEADLSRHLDLSVIPDWEVSRD